MRKVGTAILMLLLLLLATGETARAGRYLNTIDEDALLLSSAHSLVVTGPVGCDAGDTFTIRVEVTQQSSGAVAEGETSGLCTGNRSLQTTQPWQVVVHTVAPYEEIALEEGKAVAQAQIETRLDGQVTDTHNWEVDILLTSGAKVYIPRIRYEEASAPPGLLETKNPPARRWATEA